MKILSVALGEGILVPCAMGAGSYKVNTKHTNALTEADWLSDWADVGFATEDATVVAATDTFTRESTGGNWPLTNGDKVKFAYYSSVGLAAQTPPAPLAYETWYYVVQVSGLTFKLSATLGGPAINITQDLTSFTFWWRLASCPVAWPNNAADQNICIARGGLSWAMAVGATGCATARANVLPFNVDDVYTRVQSTGYSQPGWFLNSSYPA